MNLHTLNIFACLLTTTLPFKLSRSGAFYQTVINFDISHRVIATKISDNSLECAAECLTISQYEWIVFSEEESLCVLLNLYSKNNSATVPNNVERWSDDVLTWFKKTRHNVSDLKPVATDQTIDNSGTTHVQSELRLTLWKCWTRNTGHHWFRSLLPIQLC